MKKSGYDYLDLSDDDLTKEHIRHMIGGLGHNISYERLYEVNFPDKPGALAYFLKSVSDKWNISLFHYRGQGADIGKVFTGFEAKNRAKLEESLKKTGYEFSRAESNATKIFLGI